MLLGTLGASLLGIMLAGKRAIATKGGKGKLRAGDGTTRKGMDFLGHLFL